MNQMKRKVSSKQSYIKQVKNLRREINIDQETMSTTSIENLSNEILYEIFDYLDGVDIYETFSNLNYRFQQLLNSSSLLFKIKLEYSRSINEIFMENYKQIILHHKYQIFSIDLHLTSLNEQFFMSFSIDSSFDRLESLVIGRLPPNIFISFLTKLISLPRLSSLTISTENQFENLNKIFRLIFRLPILKYCRIFLSGYSSPISLPMAINKRLSPIKYLVINHACPFKELSIILSYTPQLCRLNFTDAYDNDANIGMMLPITLSDLTHLSICIHFTAFDTFEIFMRKFYSKLKILHVNISLENPTYLDSDRWEPLILEYLPQLEKFYFTYYSKFGEGCGTPIYMGPANKFSSSFWIERRWIFECECHPYQIIYSIRPYKKRWYDNVQNEIFNPSVQLLKSARLQLSFVEPDGRSLEHLLENITTVLNVAEIYHLEISGTSTFIGALIGIIYLLPKLVSLKIHCLSLFKQRGLWKEESDKLLWISERSQITKMYLEEINDIEEIDFLLKLSPCMNYLQVNCIGDIDVELFVKDILMKIIHDGNQHLRLLCFRVPTADDKIILKLQNMINVNKLLVNYEIKLVIDNIYLQWQRL